MANLRTAAWLNDRADRRGFLRAAMQAAAAGIAAPLARGADRVIGMIFPPSAAVPPDGKLLYPSGVEFLGEGLNFKGMTPESFDEVVPKIVPAALRFRLRLSHAAS